MHLFLIGVLMTVLPTGLRRPSVVFISASLSALIALPTASLPASAEVADAPDLVPVQASATAQALDQVEKVFAGHSDGSATLALRDLALSLRSADPAQKREAAGYLARPNGGRLGNEKATHAVWPGKEALASRNGDGCSATLPICVHWTNHSRHAPPLADSDHDGVPNQVETTLGVMEDVWNFEVGTLGYRRPMKDQRASIDNDGTNFDVYLSDVGASGLYGYCAVDDSRALSGHYDFFNYAGYCVLDNDFSPSQFPFHTPLQNLEVTAAHEFFHAIQFAYDATEDAWFMEGSAAWMEDELYDNVNDNRQYLRYSQFNHPEKPLDTRKGLSVYGSWGFLRYLTEKFGSDLMLKAWKRADASPTGPDDYSLIALRHAVASKGGNLAKVLGDFGAVIAEPNAFLSEGAGHFSASVKSFTLQRHGDSTGWKHFTLDHLSYAPMVIKPSDRVRNDARLKIDVDGPPRSTSPTVRVLVINSSGTARPVETLRLNRNGVGSLGLGFSPNHIRRVIVTPANVSTDFRKCYRALTQYSCFGGIPVDENKHFAVKAVVH